MGFGLCNGNGNGSVFGMADVGFFVCVQFAALHCVGKNPYLKSSHALLVSEAG